MSRGILSWGDFVLGGILSRGILSGGFCPGGFCPGGFCPDTPEDTTELRRFLGMITYLPTFVKNLSSKSSLLRKLLEKDTL